MIVPNYQNNAAKNNGHVDAKDISVKAHRLADASESERRKRQDHLEHRLELVGFEEDFADVNRDLEEIDERILFVGSPVEEEIKVRLRKGLLYLMLSSIFAICAIGLIDAALQAVFYQYWPLLRVVFAAGFALSPVAVFHLFVKRFSRLDEDGKPILSKILIVALFVITSVNLTAWSLLRNTFISAHDRQTSLEQSNEDSFAEEAAQARASSEAMEQSGAISHVVGAAAIDAAGAVTGCFGISLLFAKVKGASNLAIWHMYRRRRWLRARELELRKEMRKLAIITESVTSQEIQQNRKGR